MFNIDEIRKDFPMINNNPNMIYLDSSATSFKPQCVIDRVVKYYEEENTNIHRGDYDLSVKVSNEYENVRKTVKEFINADSEKQIVFTNGDTSSLNTIAFGYGLTHLKEGDVILTSLLEHASNILPWFKVAERTKAKIEYMPLQEDGRINFDLLEDFFKNNNVKIVAITHVSNVLGYINDVKRVCEIAHKYNAIVSVDGAQSVPHIKVDVKDLDVDFLSFSSHKMLGPSGVGVLYGKYELLEETEPLMYGGGSNARFEKDQTLILKNAPYKFESGTANIEGVLGLEEAIKYLNKIGMDNIQKHDYELVTYFMNELSKLDNVEIYNKNTDCGIVSFNVKGVFAQDAASYFNKNGFAVRSGNHCAKIIHNVIEVTESIRASLYLYNNKEEIDKFIEVVKQTTLEKCVDSIL